MIIVNYAAMCLVFGTTFLAIKVGIDAGAPPFFSAGLRFFLAGIILLLWTVWKKKAAFSLLLHKEMWLTGIGLTFGTFATLYWAEQYVSSGAAAVLSATAPLMILLIQAAILRESVSRHARFGCIIGFSGVIILVLPHISVQFNIYSTLGFIAILLGQIFYSSGTLYSKKVIKNFADTSPIALNAAQMMHGGIMLIALSLLTETVSLEMLLSPGAIASLFYLTVIGSMVGHTLFYWLIAKTNPLFPSTWLYISPIIAMTLGITL